MELFMCQCCGIYDGAHELRQKTGIKRFNYYSKPEKGICDIVIYVGGNFNAVRFDCCPKCYSVGRQWSDINIGFNKISDRESLEQ